MENNLQIDEEIEGGDEFCKKDMIQGLSDLFYSVALWDHDGFTDTEKGKVRSYLEDWDSCI